MLASSLILSSEKYPDECKTIAQQDVATLDE
jgi:hypothetical protein